MALVSLGMDASKDRLTISWWMADVATSFINYTFVGAVWGAYNPFPNSGQAMATKTTTSKFVPLPPFSSLASVCRYAGMFGSIGAVQRFASGAFAVARDRQDMWNECFGVAAVYGYASYLFKSEKCMTWNNRAVSGIVFGSIVYAQTEKRIIL